jgi:hypothetical protein
MSLATVVVSLGAAAQNRTVSFLKCVDSVVRPLEPVRDFLQEKGIWYEFVHMGGYPPGYHRICRNSYRLSKQLLLYRFSGGLT